MVSGRRGPRKVGRAGGEGGRRRGHSGILERVCVGIDVVATGEADVRSISASSEKSKKSGELGRVKIDRCH